MPIVPCEGRSPWLRRLAVASGLVLVAGCGTSSSTETGAEPAPLPEPSSNTTPNTSDAVAATPSTANGDGITPGMGGSTGNGASPNTPRTSAAPSSGSVPSSSGGSGGAPAGGSPFGGAPAQASPGGGPAAQVPTSGGSTGVAGQSAVGGQAGRPSEGASDGGAGGDTSAGEPFAGKELFILFGQSNMSGMSPMPEEPWVIDENITFMVQYDCARLDQTKDEWLPAQPPLHGCQWATGGIGLGLADYFGVALAAAWPDARIGLIPNAIPAVTIEIFMKDGPSPGGGMKALPDGYDSAYALMVDRAKEAQKLGRVRGILMHQGESDFNQGLSEQWLGRLSSVVADLRADLELSEDVPFIAGQISPDSSYSGHNEYIDQIPSTIPNSAVVSAEGTHIHDVAHFDIESARLMGERYAEALLELTTAP